MLSIGKLGFGQEHYYLDAVGRGVEDYYAEAGEAPGRWVGTASEEFGLDGVVDGDGLVAVLRGEHPRTGVQLAAPNRRVPGFDLCFRAPKSVSLLFGLGDHETSATVRAAHEHAVREALSYMEREAGFSRRGHNGTSHVPVTGFVGAAFVHRTSRAGDPHLHSHVLVANLTVGSDSRYATLDGHLLYEQARTAGFVYETVLRNELTRQLGVEWGPVRNGIADLRGIPEQVLRAFSTRRAEIEARMAERGETSARAAEIAALDTRRAKTVLDPGSLRDMWRGRAISLGFDDRSVRSLVGRVRAVDPPDHLGLGPDRLTVQASTFGRADVTRLVCEQLPGGADVAVIDHLTDELLEAPQVILVAGTRARDEPDSRLFSTRSQLALEQALLADANDRDGRDVGVVGHDDLVAALTARPSLADEQARVVTALVSSGNGVDLLVAAAGTGKTFTLDAARDAWQRAGYRVLGAALAARAASELEASTGIPSSTLHRLIADLSDSRAGGFGPATVIVVDEAAMASTRQLGVILDTAARAQAKVVLIGDPRQLPSIESGGLLAGLAARQPTLRLVENRRQREPWERAALAELRTGNVNKALDAYQEHGRVITAATAIDARDTMAADWLAATIAGIPTVMLAARRYDVEDLNQRARAAYARTGGLIGPELDVVGRTFQTGDVVLALRNDHRARLQNGLRATVIDIDPDNRELTLETQAGAHIRVPARYLMGSTTSFVERVRLVPSRQQVSTLGTWDLIASSRSCACWSVRSTLDNWWDDVLRALIH